MKANHAYLLLLVTTLWLGSVHCCDELEILECAFQFVMDVLEEDDSVITYEDLLDNMCSSPFPDLKNCWMRSSRSCPLIIRNVFGGVLNMFDYICNDGREGTILYNDCAEQPLMRLELLSCQLSMYKQSYSGIFASTDTTCGVIEDFWDCIESSVENLCGEDAAFTQNKLIRIGIGPLLESIGCDIEVDQTYTITKTRRPHLHRHRHHNQENNNNNNNLFSDWLKSVDGEGPTTQTTAAVNNIARLLKRKLAQRRTLWT